MSHEIQFHHRTSGATGLYAVVFDAAGQAYDVAAAGFEAASQGAWGDYAIALAEIGDASRIYAADLPAVAPGRYSVRVFEQVAASPSPADLLLGEGDIDWDGAAEITTANLLWQNIDSTGGTLSAAKAIEVLLAGLFGLAGYDAETGVWSVKGRDGQTTLAEITLTGQGNRTSTTIH